MALDLVNVFLPLFDNADTYPGIYPGYLHSSINLDSITYTYQRDAAYLLFLLQISSDEKNLTNALFLGNVDRSKFSITTNVSKTLVQIALNEYISLGNIIDWEERLLWLYGQAKHQKIKREEIHLIEPIARVGKSNNSLLLTRWLSRSDWTPQIWSWHHHTWTLTVPPLPMKHRL